MSESHDKPNVGWIVWYSVLSALGNIAVVQVFSSVLIAPAARDLYLAPLNSAGAWFLVSAIPLAIEAIVLPQKLGQENASKNPWPLRGVLFAASYGVYLVVVFGSLALLNAFFQLAWSHLFGI